MDEAQVVELVELYKQLKLSGKWYGSFYKGSASMASAIVRRDEEFLEIKDGQAVKSMILKQGEPNPTLYNDPGITPFKI